MVIAVAPTASPPPACADVVVTNGEEAALDGLVAAAEANPSASRTLVEVLRAAATLDVDQALLVESFAYSMLLASTEFRTWLATRPQRAPREWTGSPVRIDRHRDTLRVTLARPENRNAFGAELRDALVAALAIAEVDGAIARVVVDADGPVFSSGGDLTEFGSSSDVARAHGVRTLRSAGGAIGRLADRTTVRVQGQCVGAGVELPAFAGHVVADGGATFRLPEVAMGLIPGAGGTVSISRRIGRQATARLALSGEEITAHQALAFGLVDEVLASGTGREGAAT